MTICKRMAEVEQPPVPARETTKKERSIADQPRPSARTPAQLEALQRARAKAAEVRAKNTELRRKERELVNAQLHCSGIRLIYQSCIKELLIRLYQVV